MSNKNLMEAQNVFAYASVNDGLFLKLNLCGMNKAFCDKIEEFRNCKNILHNHNIDEAYQWLCEFESRYQGIRAIFSDFYSGHYMADFRASATCEKDIWAENEISDHVKNKMQDFFILLTGGMNALYMSGDEQNKKKMEDFFAQTNVWDEEMTDIHDAMRMADIDRDIYANAI